MKYEYRKGVFPMIMAFVVFGVIEIYFLYGTAIKDERKTATAIMFLMLATFVSYIFVLIYGVVSYSSDLKNKSGYLTFMAPISTYSIIGAKLLATLLTGLTFVAVIAIFAVIDYSYAASVYHFDSIIELLKQMLDNFGYDLTSSLFGLLAFIITFLIQFFMIVTVAYFAISLASTVLQNKKIKGVISFVIFIILIWVITGIASMSTNAMGSSSNGIDTFIEALAYELPAIIFYLACSVASFIGSGYLLERKISL
ncbi:MAG: ABC transporter permease, partial [Wujia sp.]